MLTAALILAAWLAFDVIAAPIFMRLVGFVPRGDVLSLHSSTNSPGAQRNHG